MAKITLIHDIFEKWLVASPDGQPYQPLPWDEEEFAGPQKAPFYLKPYRPPVAIIFWIFLLVGLTGLIFKLPVLGAIGSGGLSILILATRDSWIRSGALKISSEPKTVRGVEFSDFKLKLPIKNQSRNSVNHCYLFLKFPGSVEPHRVFYLAKLNAFEDVTIDMEFPLNAGMGTFDISEVSVVTVDALGFIPRCIKHPLNVRIEVLPEHAIMPPIKIEVAGKTAHSGSVEARMVGDSTSFLGLRQYRHGDNIRRIDWRKSERFSDIIVREYERLDATDATILMDQRAVGAFEYKGLSSYEHLKDTVVTLCRTLMDQRLRVRLITPKTVTDYGKGGPFMEHLIDLVKNIEPLTMEPFEQFVAEHRTLIPPYSLVIPVFSAINIDLNALLDSFWVWNDLRTQILPVAIDIPRFEAKIASEAHFGPSEHEGLHLLRELYGQLPDPSGETILRKISEQTIVIGPGESIGDVYARRSSWRQ